MSFTQAVQSVLQNYANFNGRAMRSEYWWWALFTFLAAVALSFIEAAVGLTGILTSLWALGTFLPGLAVLVRRLHDRGRSAWFLLWFLLPILGALWIFLQTISIGDWNDNAYGPPPTAP